MWCCVVVLAIILNTAAAVYGLELSIIMMSKQGKYYYESPNRNGGYLEYKSHAYIW